jgi:hypothetical protein
MTMTEDMWMALAASFGPILRHAFPKASAGERMAVCEALRDQVKLREHWFAPRDTDGSPKGRDSVAGSTRSATAGAAESGIAQTHSHPPLHGKG